MSASRLTLTNTELLSVVPDSPKYVEARSMLLRGTAVVFGVDAENCILCDRETDLLFALGCPPEPVLTGALDLHPDAETLIAVPEHADAFTSILRGWEPHRVQVHILEQLRQPPRLQECRWLRPAEILKIPNDTELLPDNLLAASHRSRIAAVFAGTRPVSFCFATSHTASFWNVSIETLKLHRRRGFGGACVSWTVERWLTRNIRPVWGAAESNPESLAMAARLGFLPLDRLAVFRRPPPC